MGGVKLVVVECRALYSGTNLLFVGSDLQEEKVSVSVIGGKGDEDEVFETATILGAGDWTAGDDGLRHRTFLLQTMMNRARAQAEETLVISDYSQDRIAAEQLGCRYFLPVTLDRALGLGFGIKDFLRELNGS